MKHPSERLVVLLVASFQFVNILDFMIVMPLGPQFSSELGIAEHYLGVVAGIYTLAGAVAGIAGSFFLDRFDRRKALAVSMFGLMSATALGGLAFNLESLLASRVLAGIFGGPATSLSLSVIADVIPVQKRGRAMATVMMGFSVASIFGVPIALELAHIAGWRAPFFGVAALGLVISASSLYLLPPMKHHFEARLANKQTPFWEMFTKPLPLLSYASMACMMFSAFTLIPMIPSYVLHNLDYKGEPWLNHAIQSIGINYTFSALGALYLFGGMASLAMMQIVGRMTDRVGSAVMSWIGGVLLCGVIYCAFIDYQPWLSVLGIYIAFMGISSLRGVPARTLDTRVPRAHERAGFMSAQSAVQHITLAIAASMSSLFLQEAPDKSLVGMPMLGWLSVTFALLLPVFVTLTERGLKKRDLAQARAEDAPAPKTPYATPTLAPTALVDEVPASGNQAAIR